MSFHSLHIILHVNVFYISLLRLIHWTDFYSQTKHIRLIQSICYMQFYLFSNMDAPISFSAPASIGPNQRRS